MNELAPIIASILDELGVDAPSASLVTIGLADADMPDVGAVDAYEAPSGPEDLPLLRLYGMIPETALPLVSLAVEKIES